MERKQHHDLSNDKYEQRNPHSRATKPTTSSFLATESAGSSQENGRLVFEDHFTLFVFRFYLSSHRSCLSFVQNFKQLYVISQLATCGNGLLDREILFAVKELCLKEGFRQRIQTIQRKHTGLKFGNQSKLMPDEAKNWGTTPNVGIAEKFSSPSKVHFSSFSVAPTPRL